MFQKSKISPQIKQKSQISPTDISKKYNIFIKINFSHKSKFFRGKNDLRSELHVGRLWRM